MPESTQAVAVPVEPSVRPRAQEIARLRAIAADYEALMARWEAALPYSQEVANLHATFKASDRTAGEAFARGEVTRVLDDNECLRALLRRALPMASALDATKTAVVWTADLQCDASGLVRDIKAALGA